MTPNIDYSRRVYHRRNAGSNPPSFTISEDCYCFIHTTNAPYNETIRVNGNLVARLAEDNLMLFLRKGDVLLGGRDLDSSSTYDYCFAYKK